MNKALDWYENGIEDGLDGVEAEPDPLYFDDYMAGYLAGKGIRESPGWLDRYDAGYKDGLVNGEVKMPKSLAYLRGYSEGVCVLLSSIEKENQNENG